MHRGFADPKMTRGSAHGCACVRDILPDADATLLNAIMHLTTPPNVLERICIPRRQLACGRTGGQRDAKKDRDGLSRFWYCQQWADSRKKQPLKTRVKEKRTKRLFHAFRALNGGGAEGLLIHVGVT